MIYKPVQESAAASTSLLVHTAPPTTADKGTQNQDQNNQYQLAPIQNPNQQRGGGNSTRAGRAQVQNRGRRGLQGRNNNNKYDGNNRRRG